MASEDEGELFDLTDTRTDAALSFDEDQDYFSSTATTTPAAAAAATATTTMAGKGDGHASSLLPSAFLQETSSSNHNFNHVASEEEEEEEEARKQQQPSRALKSAETSQPLSRKRTSPAQHENLLVKPSPQHQQQQQQMITASSRPALETRVLDPRIVGDVGISVPTSSTPGSISGGASSSKKDKFVVYRVETRVNDVMLSQSHFDGHSTFSVLRRFSDFDWLHAQLEARFPGFIIPPLPDKTVPLLQNNLSEQFYTTRARALDKFLVHVTGHNVLSRDAIVRDFLIAEQQRFEAMRRRGTSMATSAGLGESSTAYSAPASGFFEKVLDWGSSIKEQVGTSLAGTARIGAELRSKSSKDELFEDASRYIEEMEPKLRLCFDISRRIVAQNTELAKAMHELGLAFTSVGQSEQNEELSRTITELGNVCGGAQGIALKLNLLVVDEEAKFLEPMEDYVRLIAAAKQALAIRVKTCSTYEVALGELHFKREARSKLAVSSSGGMMMGGGGGELKIDLEITELERRVESAKSDFDLVTERVLKEVERFKREKAQDFKTLILDYVQLQIDYNVKVEELWRSLLPRLSVE